MSRLAVGSIEGLASEGYKITVPTGSKIIQAGAVLQVVSTTKIDTFSASVAPAGIVDVTGLSVTITPTSTSSLILCIAQVGKGTYGSLVLKRGSTEIAIGAAAGNRNQISANALATDGNHPTFVGMHILDNPATTNATTYQVALHQHVTSTVTLHCNRSDTDTDSTASSRTASSITVMEIAG